MFDNIFHQPPRLLLVVSGQDFQSPTQKITLLTSTSHPTSHQITLIVRYSQRLRGANRGPQILKMHSDNSRFLGHHSFLPSCLSVSLCLSLSLIDIPPELHKLSNHRKKLRSKLHKRSHEQSVPVLPPTRQNPFKKPFQKNCGGGRWRRVDGVGRNWSSYVQSIARENHRLETEGVASLTNGSDSQLPTFLSTYQVNLRPTPVIPTFPRNYLSRPLLDQCLYRYIYKLPGCE